MKGRNFFASLAIVSLLVAMAGAQVAPLGSVPFRGKVRQTGLFQRLAGGGAGCCDAGCTGCDSCGISGPSCGLAAPTCGLAGRLLGGASCGLPEPRCGSAGLGYAGGFGLCGGCDSCGVGGYVGRNIHQVNPCACGGSLIADMARGLFCLVDRTVSSVVGGLFGGLQAVTCHASGTFAALQCAAQASCYACGSVGCDGGCGMAASDYGMTYDQGYESLPAYSSESTRSSANQLPEPLEPTPAEEGSAQPDPLPSDPFTDDPPPQALRRPRPLTLGHRLPVHGQQVRRATYRVPQSPRIGNAVQNTMRNVRRAAASVVAPPQPRYLQSQLQHRSMNLRR